MHTIRRILSFYLALMAVVALLVACAPVAHTGSAPADAPAASAEEPVTITIAAQSGHTGATAAKDKLADFEAATGIKVEFVEIPEGELTQKLLLEFGGQTGRYDALMAPEDAFANYVINGYLATLDEAGGAPEDVDDFIPRFLDRIRYDVSTETLYTGDLYGLPLNGDVNVLYYNTELFEAAGLDPDTPPATWEEFREVAKALTKDGVYGTAWLGVQGDASTWAWATYLFSFGGEYFDADDRPVFNSEQGVAALQYIVDLIHTDQVMPPSVPSWDYDQINAGFPQGQVAMVVNWPYMLGLANDATQSQVVDKVKIALAPMGETYGVPSGGWKWLIAKDSQHKAEALEFITYMTSQEFQLYMTETYNQLPTRNSVYEEMKVRKPDYTWQVWQDAFSQAARFMPVQYPEWPQISSIISLALQQAQLQEKTPQEALDEAAAAVEALMQEAGYYE
jgi:multiple sugar transport system substrate-binding protein